MKTALDAAHYTPLPKSRQRKTARSYVVMNQGASLTFGTSRQRSCLVFATHLRYKLGYKLLTARPYPHWQVRNGLAQAH